MTTLRLLPSGALAMAMGLTAGSAALGQDGARGCDLANGALPQGCTSDNLGAASGGQVGADVAVSAGVPGDMGFQITIGAAAEGNLAVVADSAVQAADQGPEAAPAPGPPGRGSAIPDVRDAPDAPIVRDAGLSLAGFDVGQERVGHLLDRLGVSVRYAGLGIRPRLNVAVESLAEEVSPGALVSFQAASNYPAWIARAQVVVRDARDGRLVAVLPIAANGRAAWQAPAAEGDLIYTLEARDVQGRLDMTRPRALHVRAGALEAAGHDPSALEAALSEDRTARRSIPVRGGAVVVSGDDLPEDVTLTVMGGRVESAPGRPFVVERILPVGSHGVVVSGTGAGESSTLTRQVDVPSSDWFATALGDVTVGRDWAQGHLAGFAQGRLADGTEVTAAIDTQDRPLEDVFDDLLARDPQRVLRDIDPRDVFSTFGDDATREELAPTSGRLFARVARDGAYAQLGDFTTSPFLSGVSRNDRTLYGVSAAWESLDQVEAFTGEPGALNVPAHPRLRTGAFAASAETAGQRDDIAATGGSAYFLSRRDVVRDSETVLVEVRDAVSGQVLSRRELQPGLDYRLNPLQGTVFLREPLSPQGDLGAGGVVNEGVGDDVEVRLLVSYEYVPSGGLDDGVIAGGRTEGWIAPALRLGVEGTLDQSTGPETSTLSADALYAFGARSSVLYQEGRSRGPGTGLAVSDDGGLSVERAGRQGDARARGRRLTGEIALADLRMRGEDPGFLSFFLAEEDAGFVSSEGVVEDARTRAGVSGEMALGVSQRLTFGTRMERTRPTEGRDTLDQQIWAGWAFAPTEGRRTEVELRQTRREGTFGLSGATTLGEEGTGADGSRQDLGLRHAWTDGAGRSWWAYAQGTLAVEGDMERNDRVGAGVKTPFAFGADLIADVSYGTLGWGAEIGLTRTDGPGTTRSLSYQLDPTRRFEQDGVSGLDRGILALSSTRRFSEAWSSTAEIRMDASGDQGSRMQRYGLAWAPSEAWRLDASLIGGYSVNEADEKVSKRGLSLGAVRTEPEGSSGSLRMEWLRDRVEDEGTGEGDLDSLAIKALSETRMSEDWRLITSLDALLSRDSSESGEDGRYVEGNFGYARRPAISDRINVLLSYTFLDDRPADDQANFDGETEGEGQTSHIVNAYISRELGERWTLGTKVGGRLRETYPRDGGEAARSSALLAIARMDYHLTYDWDATFEVRSLWAQSARQESAGLVSVSRALNEHVRLAGGYAWGGVSDDLRAIENDHKGPFIGLTVSF